MSAGACAARPARGFSSVPGRTRLAERAVKLALLVAVLAVFARPLAGVVALFGGLALAGAFARHEREQAWRRGAGEAREARPFPSRRREPAAADDTELGAILASLADGIRDPLRAAQGLVRQMGEDPGSRRNVDCARLALREIDRLESNVSRLLAEAHAAAQRRAGGGSPA